MLECRCPINVSSLSLFFPPLSLATSSPVGSLVGHYGTLPDPKLLVFLLGMFLLLKSFWYVPGLPHCLVVTVWCISLSKFCLFASFLISLFKKLCCEYTWRKNNKGLQNTVWAKRLLFTYAISKNQEVYSILTKMLWKSELIIPLLEPCKLP